MAGDEESFELPSNDPKIRRVRFGEVTLNVPIGYRASISETNINIRTYWPGLPAHDSAPIGRVHRELIYIILNPAYQQKDRLPLLGRIDSLLSAGKISAPVFDATLDLYVYSNNSGVAKFFRPSLDSDIDNSPLVFSCSENPNMAVEVQQQCRGYIRIVPSVQLQYRFNVSQLEKWKELNEDIQALVSSFFENP